MNTEDEKSIFGNNLQVLTNQRNWTIQQAAREIGYDRNDFSAILSGTKNFKLQTAVKFAQFFNVSVFLLFTRLFKDGEYRACFPFVEKDDYMVIVRKNFQSLSTRQSDVAMDPSTVSQIMNGRRNNLTINTLHTIAASASVPLCELLKTEQDKKTEEKLKEDAK